MYKKIILAAAVALSMGSANAATIALNKGLAAGFNVQNAAGQSIQSFVFVGTFAGGTAPSGTPDEIKNLFSTFGTLAAPIAAGGTLQGGIDYSGVIDDAVFETLKIFIIVANNANLAQATQFGVFTNNPSTLFPADVEAGGSFNFNVNSFATLEAVVGSKVDNATGPDTLRLVPEPSAALSRPAWRGGPASPPSLRPGDSSLILLAGEAFGFTRFFVGDSRYCEMGYRTIGPEITDANAGLI